jgi:ABC-type Fe3+/spermidine/putrescine transport system ATPase subunit
MASSLLVESVTRRFGSLAAVDDVTLAVAGGEFLGLLGPSGCGKTTLLRLIAGFLLPDAGRIRCDDKDITSLPPYARNLGVVFQNYALFPHMTAAENVGYGLKVRGIGKAEAAQRVRTALDRVGLAKAEDRFPSQLSGGMQQRVALARALVIEPAILLLDEPLSALDKNLREEMQVELRLLQQRVGITTVFVTHDQEEAMTLSDRIAVMQAGKIRQLGRPEEVYRRPTSAFVATFLGTTNIVAGTARGLQGEALLVETAGGGLVQARPDAAPAPGAAVRLAVRPESVVLAPDGPGLPGTVGDVLFQGHRLIVLFHADGGAELRAFAAPGGWSLAKGQRAVASWPAAEAGLLAD